MVIDDFETLRKLDLAHCLHPSTALADHQAKGPHVYVEGRGCYVKDIDGKEYLECRSGNINCNVGYGDPEVAQAAYDQMVTLQFTNSGGGQATVPYIRLCAKLASLLPPELSRVGIYNSGSEVVEAAIKVSRYVNRLEGRPEKHKVVSRKLAYHGASLGTTPFTDVPRLKKAALPMAPGHVHIEAPYCYRCPFGKTYPSCEVDCARELERVVQQEGPETVAAFLGEPVMQLAGALVPPKEYYPIIRAICDRYDVTMVVDEVVTGLGRTGEIWGLQHWGTWPDIVTTSKAMGSGYFPVGATIIKESLYQRLLKAGPEGMLPHLFTFTGSPVGCAVALKNIEIIEKRGLVENARAMGQRLADGLNEMREMPIVGDVRAIGLLASLELVKDKATREPVPAALMPQLNQLTMERGVLVRFPGPNCILMCPPLIIDADQIDRLLRVVRDSLAIFQKATGVAALA
ncbi:MAG: aspartate aminotransferase family protein [Chloroflexi bacterium]|nr:aspartate aminotransferase family protein [Chloroflexota bacterium]